MESSLKILRDRKTSTAEFRAASRKLCTLLMRTLRALLRRRGTDPEKIVPVIILRAALAFLESAHGEFPGVPVGVFGLKRDERTKRSHWYYENLPPLSKRSVVVVLDPMLATGGSAEAAVRRLVERGVEPKNIYFVGIIAAPEGVARLERHVPRENIVLAAMDKGLNAQKYIVPGLGDFGDRYFGYSDAPVSRRK